MVVLEGGAYNIPFSAAIDENAGRVAIDGAFKREEGFARNRSCEGR